MRAEEEKAVKELSIAVSGLLECYQWDHLDIDYQLVEKRIASVQQKLLELQYLLSDNLLPEE